MQATGGQATGGQGTGGRGMSGAGAAAVDPREVERFGALAARWWDPVGPLAPLHAMTPCRMGYAIAQIAATHGRDRRALRALEGLAVLDIGCGGGLAAEPLARVGAAVTGIDPAEENIAAARAHAAEGGLAIDYRASTAEVLAAEGHRFDAVLALEVVEHVPDRAGFVATAAGLVAPGGCLILSTLNRTARAYAVAILGAEVVLRWLPTGTHDWARFVRPSELAEEAAAAGLSVADLRGMVWDPLRGWRLSRDTGVNYLLTALAGPAR